ncbi:transposase [Thermoanaerobacter wiegelii]|uniref:Transposase IS4 family protein n=1 Tax=Thermoanaerobacter wiegelii Rt8.B1 TaxID=697303 RepID=G2MT15_9THEO|nr:transposase [Thermoanaerobacter wiegelii]AEM78601.1 transposase IS4 family protein [Thermoanaerobacter wiegelii Rt8.B1]AEM79521.1 transposase IS4 family protein [Thermoanaerobacter wiegelii Rt8.B1]
MNKCYLKQMLTYFSKVYHLGEKIKGLKDGRLNPQIETSTISFIVLLTFICRLKSFNRLEHWLKKRRFKNLFPKKTRLPHIDAVRRSLSSFDINGLNILHDHIISTIFKNKVFRNGTIDGIKVAAIDGVEIFESTKKRCEKCLTRVDKQGITHYFHRAVVCATVGSDPHIVLGYEMLEPKKDLSNKDEGEITGGKRLIRKLYKKFHHFADVIVADALYCKASWIMEVLAIGMDAVIRVKDERLHIVKDALGLFQRREADKQWIVREGNTKKIIVSAWDDDGFEMRGMDIKVRFIRFLENIQEGDKKELKEVWIVTTNKNICVETLWKIIHKRWDIENNVFHQLKAECHFDHCYLHSPRGVEAIVEFMMIAFNLTQLYFFRNIRGFRGKRHLQINIIEDLKDEMLIIMNWINPIFNTT